MSTKEQMQGYLLLCARAFSGKRGRTGLISFMLGQAGPSTVELAKEQGVGELSGILSASTSQEIHLALTDLQNRGCLEIRDTLIRDRSMPLIYLTDKGSFELERLRPSLSLPLTTAARSPEKVLLVLTRLGKLIEGLCTQPSSALPHFLGVDDKLFDLYFELLCKALDIRKDVPLSSPAAQRQFAARLEIALVSNVFAALPEVEAQAVRLVTGIRAKHQLSAEDFEQYYGHVDIREQARVSAARMLTREWQGKSSLASVIGFLVLSERTGGDN